MLSITLHSQTFQQLQIYRELTGKVRGGMEGRGGVDIPLFVKHALGIYFFLNKKLSLCLQLKLSSLPSSAA